MKNKPCKLEDYSKDVLIHYIKNRCLYSIKDLENIKKELEIDNLFQETDQIIKIKSKLKLPEQFSEYFKLTDKYEKIQKRLDKLLDIDSE